MTNRIVCTFAVLAHLAVNILHGRAHESLGVGLNTFQNIYVFGVILIAPLIARAKPVPTLRRVRLAGLRRIDDKACVLFSD